MYEELVKQCRSCLDSLCGECKYEHLQKAGNFVRCMNALLVEATNAIEELSRDLDCMNDANIALYGALPQWIPVAERLPEDGKFVLVCNDDGHMMIAKHETETYEWYYKYTNYDFDIWDNEEQGPVCYWMPLPEPPKEET